MVVGLCCTQRGNKSVDGQIAGNGYCFSNILYETKNHNFYTKNILVHTRESRKLFISLVVLVAQVYKRLSEDVKKQNINIREISF